MRERLIDLTPAGFAPGDVADAMRRGWCFFGSSPSLPPVQALPTRADPAIAEAAKKARLAAANRKGRRSTRIAGLLGDEGPAPVERTLLLGQ